MGHALYTGGALLGGFVNKIERGAYGEGLALKYLQGIGYKLLEQNSRFGHKEIDIIMEDGPSIVFVEVKSRSYTKYGYPREAVNSKKQQNLMIAAQTYLSRFGVERRARFDVVEVDLKTGGVTHIKNAFS